MIRLAVGLLLLAGCAVADAALTLYVSPDGSDDASGRTDQPFATLERARDEIRTLKGGAGLPVGGVVVELAPGVYELDAPIELTADDGGTEASPITYRSRKAGEARLLGGKLVGGWSPVTDEAVLDRLEQSARGKVYQADLKAHGIEEYGGPDGGGLELFFNNEPMTLARWPNEGFVKIVDVLEVEPVDVRGTKGDKGGKLVYDGDRPLRWADEKDLWLHGYWFWDWSDQRMRVDSIDTEERVISLAEPEKHGYGYRKGQWYYALNALSEIDAPGEWYLDRDTGTLYFYPPASLDEAEVLVSVIPSLVTLDGANWTTVQGFLMEATRGTAVTLANSSDSRVLSCTIRNVGGQGVSVSGGERCSVMGCDIYQTAKGGISLNGGDRATLTPAGHLAENNHIHHFARWYRMYNAAIHIYGVGNRAAHNLMHDAPHTAIFFGGNDHVIELNEIHSVCHESNDAGAIYSGRNWTMRGTAVRNNYMHHVNGFEGRGCVGVYLDDMFCGTEISGNVFYRVTRAAFIGGGRDNQVLNNIFVDCNPSLHIDSRAMGWAKYHTEGWVKELEEKRIHLGIPLLDPPYITRYPELATVETGDPYAPEGNIVARNVSWGGKWDGVQAQARPYVTFEDNLIDVDPLFVNPKKLDFRLKKSSPAWDIGFQPIPIETIGLYQDPLRASWPVEHKVRPMVEPPKPKPLRPGPPPVLKASRAGTPAAIDGVISAGEWAGNPAPIEQGIRAEKAGPPGRFHVAWSDEALLLAIENDLDPSKPVSTGNTWGQDDAVEVAIRDLARDDAPILVLRGYPNGHFESSVEAGASPRSARRAGRDVEYAATVEGAKSWCAELRVPWDSLGIEPKRGSRFQFNISVRKLAPEGVWLMWLGTGAHTWDIDKAGVLELSN